MKKIKNPTIKLKEYLDEKDAKDIYELEKFCLESDKITLKLEIDYKLSKAKGKNINLKKINEFMYYENSKLIGYIGICEFGGGALEVNGMTHPEYRRMGVFKKLFSLVKDEWNKRESKKMLLLCDNNSADGIEFIKYSGATYEHSEYEMFLNHNFKENTETKSVVLRNATKGDAREIAWQNSIYFNIEFKEEDVLKAVEEDDNSFSYIAEVNNKIIGKVRLEINGELGAIYGLGVIPEHRSKGYGREILIRSIEKLSDRNAKEIMLQVLTNNNNALNLYKSCGFEDTSTMNYYELIQ